VTTKERIRELLAEAKVAREESLRLWRENRSEMLAAEAAVRLERSSRERVERAKTEAVLERLRAGGPEATERAICRDLRVSPKRVVRLRALLRAERSDLAKRSAAAGPAVSPLARV
jgi:hypothetical protein